MVVRQAVGRGRCLARQRSQIQSCQGVENGDFVSCIGVNTLVQRERDIVAVERRVCCRIVFRDESLTKSRDQLLNVAESLRSADRRGETLVAIERDVESLLKHLEVLLREQTAEFRIAKGNSLFAGPVSATALT